MIKIEAFASPQKVAFSVFEKVCHHDRKILLCTVEYSKATSLDAPIIQQQQQGIYHYHRSIANDSIYGCTRHHEEQQQQQ